MKKNKKIKKEISGKNNDDIWIAISTIIVFMVPLIAFICLGLIIRTYKGDWSIRRSLSQETEDGWQYIKLIGDETHYPIVVITGYSGNEHNVLKMPSYIDDAPVKITSGNVIKIGYDLSKLIIPNTVEEIGDYCLHLSEVSEVEFEEYSHLKKIGRLSLGTQTMTSITLPDSVEEISKEAFAYGFNLTDIYIGPNVHKIGDGAFYESKISNIFVSEDNDFFEVRDGLLIDKRSMRLLAYDHEENPLVIPDYILEIDEEALDGRGGLSSIKVDDNNPNFKSINGCLYTKDGKTLVKAPAGMKVTDFVIEPGTEIIGRFALRDCFAFEKIELPESVKDIEFFALQNQDIYVHEGLESCDVQGFTGTIHYYGSRSSWSQVSVTNAYPDDILEYDLEIMGGY